MIRGTSPSAAPDDRLAGRQRGGRERPRPGQPARVAGHRQHRAHALGRAPPQHRQRPAQRDLAVHPGQPGHPVRLVGAGHPRDHVVVRRLAGQPGRRPGGEHPGAHPHAGHPTCWLASRSPAPARHGEPDPPGTVRLASACVSNDYRRPTCWPATWRRNARQCPTVPAEPDLVVEEAGTGFCGAVVECAKDAVTLEDRRGRRRVFPLGAGRLPARRPAGDADPAGGRAGPAPAGPHRVRLGRGRQRAGARVARGSRIWVEGVHDAALVERVWGDDLRVEAVVVEPLDGIDDLAGAVRDVPARARPPARRAGRPPGARLQGEPDRRRGDRTRTCWSSATRTSTSGRR